MLNTGDAAGGLKIRKRSLLGRRSTELAVTPHLLILLSEGTSACKSHLRLKTCCCIGSQPTSTRAEYPELPGTKREIAGIRKSSKAARRLSQGRRRTPRSFLGAMPASYSMIHFAAHAEANLQSPLDSAVILSEDLSEDGKGFKLYAQGHRRICNSPPILVTPVGVP